MFQSLLAAGIAAAIVWWLLRRQSTVGSQEGASAKEIDRLRATVEELSTALEQRAEAVDRKLSATIEEARTVHGLLDRTLAAVGAQIVGEPTPARSLVRPGLGLGAARSDLPKRDGDETKARAEPTTMNVMAEQPSSRAEAAADAVGASAFVETGIPAFLAKAESLPDGPEAEPIADAGAYDKASMELASEPATDTAIDAATDREECVIALVESGITDSVDIARQTGLTRGEVELIMILHGRGQAPVVPGGNLVAEAPVVPGGNLVAGADVDAVTAPPVSQAGDDRYTAIYALIASGVTDPVEIARKTGLGRGEVELHMGLHARNVL